LDTYNVNDPDCCPQDLSDEEYWVPYYADGPLTCECDEDNGYVYDDDFNDGRCFDCKSLGEECTFCSYDTVTTNKWTCD